MTNVLVSELRWVAEMLYVVFVLRRSLDFRAYQSPCSGTHCGLQCAQIPNFASRNQSGQRYAFRDSQKGKNGPSAICPRKNCESPNTLETPVNAKAHAPPSRSDRRFTLLTPY